MAKRRQTVTKWAQSLQHGSSDVLELEDSRSIVLDTGFLSRHVQTRDPNAVIAKLLNQFLQFNRASFDALDIEPQPVFTGDAVRLRLISHTRIGAVPLMSPITFKPEFSLIIKPRFGWNGVGPVLLSTGWKVLPDILRMPSLKISERRIPPWVLSTVVLSRLDNLIRNLSREFEMVEEEQSIPRGSVNWTRYAQKNLPNGRLQSLPCRYPDLQADQELTAAIHFVLSRQLQSLNTQRSMGVHVIQLVEYARQLLAKVKHVPPQKPQSLHLQQLQSRSKQLTGTTMHQGIEAIEWTVQEKGLAGLGDFHGLPWMMSMETLFEAYVESVMERLLRLRGGVLKRGRTRETIVPIHWDPPITGSQRYLMPDLIIERDEVSCIVDAKYKDHWEDLNVDSWMRLEEEIRNRHRHDVHQILAYAATHEAGVIGAVNSSGEYLFDTSDRKSIICCLMYPCTRETWLSLVSRNRHIHEAELGHSGQNIRLMLTAMPFQLPDEELKHLLRVLG